MEVLATLMRQTTAAKSVNDRQVLFSRAMQRARLRIGGGRVLRNVSAGNEAVILLTFGSTTVRYDHLPNPERFYVNHLPCGEGNLCHQCLIKTRS
jgi:hypothetical protein